MLSTIMTPLPAVAIMPLIIMWFGIRTEAMLVLICQETITRDGAVGIRNPFTNKVNGTYRDKWKS